jgi:hypothetical protein
MAGWSGRHEGHTVTLGPQGVDGHQTGPRGQQGGIP